MVRRTKRITSDRFAVSLDEIFERYEQKLGKNATDVVKNTAEHCEEILHKTPPTPEKKGDYAAGWSVENKSKGAEKPIYVVKNRDYPSLTHLLEKGHLIKATGGRTRAIKHIKPAANKSKAKLRREIRKTL